MLSVVTTPSTNWGRPAIFGTVLSDERGPMCMARNVFFGPENHGNTGCPRVDIWVALRQGTLQPVVVRGRPASRIGHAKPKQYRPAQWETMRGKHELSEDNLVKLALVLASMGYQTADVWTPHAAATWPLNPWDSRVVLPGDKRWPKSQRPRAKGVKALLSRLGACEPAEVWIVEIMILARSLRSDK